MAPRTGTLNKLAILAIAVLLLLAGCGGGTSSSAPTGGSTTFSSSGSTGEEDSASSPGEKGDSEGGKAQRESVPTANVALLVPAAPVSTSAPGTLHATYTCAGKNTSPAVEWTGIPSNTAELQLFVMNLAPVNGKLYFDYALAGIDPSLKGLKAGEVPEGAVIGKNSAGQDKYDLCPPGSNTEQVVFALYAVGKSLSPKTSFEPLVTREQAIAASEGVGLFSAYASGH
jgi:phosphatidylethanolamine-binding protein (PEBP) family uncharacterized protein